MGALDMVYSGVIADHRKAVRATEELDPVTQDMLIGHLRRLESFQWFVRAHLENPRGMLSVSPGDSERQAARKAAERAIQQP